MKLCKGRFSLSLSFPFFAAAAFFLAGGMYENYICAIFFASAHELGHLIPMKIAGCKIKEISLGAMGIRIEKNNVCMSYKAECIAALCGPAVNTVAAVVFFFLKDRYDVFVLPFNINIGLFLINMLPVRMLDGGRFVNNLLLLKLDEITAYKVMSYLEIAVIIVLVLLLIVMLIAHVVNTSFVFFVCSFVGITVVSLIKKDQIYT